MLKNVIKMLNKFKKTCKKSEKPISLKEEKRYFVTFGITGKY